MSSSTHFQFCLGAHTSQKQLAAQEKVKKTLARLTSPSIAEICFEYARELSEEEKTTGAIAWYMIRMLLPGEISAKFHYVVAQALDVNKYQSIAGIRMSVECTLPQVFNKGGNIQRPWVTWTPNRTSLWNVLRSLSQDEKSALYYELVDRFPSFCNSKKIGIKPKTVIKKSKKIVRQQLTREEVLQRRVQRRARKKDDKKKRIIKSLLNYKDKEGIPGYVYYDMKQRRFESGLKAYEKYL